MPATIALGPEDASSGMKLTVSLSRACADFSPSAQLLPSLSGGGSVRLITADDTPGPNDGIVTEPGLWSIDVSVEKNADNEVACASGEATDPCAWTFDYRAAKAP